MVFGGDFRNEIVWGYKSGGASKEKFAKKHDIIFLFGKTKTVFFETQYYKRYLLRDPKTGKEIGRDPRKNIVKYYTDPIGTYRKNIMRDVWDDIGIISPNSKKERLGYPTQKPIALLDRIIKASCPKDGIVLDPFCGCGTSTHSAINNKRRWIGVDISSNATAVIKERIKDVGAIENKNYQFIDGSPATKEAYNSMDAFKKQDWLIDKVGGFPNPKKSGDGGVDGEMTLHLGHKKDKTGKLQGDDIWGKMVFSVKTGKQCKPEFVRELLGTMKLQNAIMGGLILEADPSENMEITAQNKGQLKYEYSKELPPQYHDTIQIRTADEIIDGKKFDTPPTLKDIQLYRGKNTILSF